MVMNDAQKFTCTTFHMDMPIETQPGFCAKRQRKAQAGDYCGICPEGIKAAKETRDPALDSPYKKVREDAEKREQGLGKTVENKEADMAEKKWCSEGCGKGAVKDGLCTRHYKEKHGEAPFPSGKKPPVKRQAGRQGNKPSPGKKPRATGGHDHECEGCKVLQMQLDELAVAEKIMVAAGLVAPEKFEQARKIVRELGK